MTPLFLPPIARRRQTPPARRVVAASRNPFTTWHPASWYVDNLIAED